jgi:DtxR family Mn-dependent transcriptional regulator
MFAPSMISITEENYLKAIYALSQSEPGKIPNFSIAQSLDINPATVTEMLRKLADKKWIDYSRSGGATLTIEGQSLALKVIRKHRLWETFLVQNLEFRWDEVHEVAEQLEHIQSEKLLDQLDRFLGYPRFDPHGDPIPNASGQLPISTAGLLSDCKPGDKKKFVAVANHSQVFLQYLDKIGFRIQDNLEVEAINEFDKSMNVILKGEIKTIFSAEVSQGLMVI